MTVFDKNADYYDNWFINHPLIYKAELHAIEKLIPEQQGKGLEIGSGTGRFAIPLNIDVGIEPSREMGDIARSKGFNSLTAVAEDLPFDDGSFDYSVMVTTICFIEDIPKAMSEAFRVLKPGGVLIVGFVDKESFLGLEYQDRSSRSRFYADANFYSTGEVKKFMEDGGFHSFRYRQAVFKDDMSNIKSSDGFGTGSFVAISGVK